MSFLSRLRVTRRRFLGMAGAFAVITGLPGVAEALPNPGVPRPPGVFNEDEFQEKCIRCRACVNVCPSHALDAAHLDQGLRNLGTPVLLAADRYCMVFKGLVYPPVDLASAKNVASVGLAWKAQGNENAELCEQCIDVCPTQALQPATLAQFHLGTAVVHRENCFGWQYRNCSFPCVDACVFNAITLSPGPVVNPTKCTGCNQCAYVCIARLQPGPSGIEVEAAQA